jgi:hypothetical protein
VGKVAGSIRCPASSRYYGGLPRTKPKSKSAKPVETSAVPPKGGVEWRPHLLPVLLIWGAVLLAYANSFQTGLPIDNRLIILQDPRIRSATAEHLQQIVTGEYWYALTGNGLYRPLTTLSYLFNGAILGNGPNPAGYHVINFLLQALNGSLLYLVGWCLFRKKIPALMLAGLWVVHPVLTESVTNIVGRADLLAGFGVLSGLLCYVRASGPGRRRMIWLAAACLAMTVAMFSKESGIVLLALVVLYDLVFGRAGEWRRRVMGYAALAVPCVFFLAVRSQVLAHGVPVRFPPTDNPLLLVDFWTAKLTAIKVIGKEVWLLAWPLHLSCDYSYNQIPLFNWRLGDWETWKAILSLAGCLGATCAAIVYRRRNPLLAFFIGFFFLTLAPTANILIPIGTIMAERLLYLPAIGFVGCLVLLLGRLLRGRALPVAAALIAVAFAGRTFARNFDWQDDARIWLAARAASPNSFKTHLPQVLSDRDSDVKEVDRSLAIIGTLPDSEQPASVYGSAGQAYRLKGESVGGGVSPESRAWYLKALAIMQHGERVEVASGIRAPYFLYQELGRTYLRLGEAAKAAVAFNEVCNRDLEPGAFEALAVAQQEAGDLHAAAMALMEGLLAETTNRQIPAELSDIYRHMDPAGCASSLDLACPAFHADYCAASASMAGRLSRGGKADAAFKTERQAEAKGCR